MTISHVAYAAGGPLVPAGLVDGDDAGEASFATVDRPGLRLSSKLQLRMDMSDRISSVVHGVSPMKTNLVDIRKHRRMGMMLDYFPINSSGFFLSTGWRKSPARTRWAPGSTANSLLGFAPNISQPLRVATNVARQAPAMMAGWSGMIGKDMTIGFSAGAMQEHGRTTRISSAALVRPLGDNASWSRVGALAQFNVGIKF